MRFRRFLTALGWEFIQNLPMITGFAIAAKLRSERLLLALAVLVFGISLGIVIMHYTEPKLHREKLESNWKADLLNLAIFLVLSLPFLFYFSVETRWINWKSDLVLGLVLGVILALGQSLAWTGEKARMVVHGVAMAVSFPCFMVSLRFLLKVESWLWMLILVGLATLGASAIIVLIDYREMFLSTEGAQKREI